MRYFLAFTAAAAVLLAGCDRPTGTAPQGSEVGAAMPDTTQPRDPDEALTAPDAAVTGGVPADGSPPAVRTEPAPPPADAPR